MQRLFVLELNEFNIDLLREAAAAYDLKNIKSILSWSKTETVSPDTYESNFLEPWVQWVSIHTGVPSAAHGIKHLGDVPGLNVQQLWEALDAEGITTGVWGAMNASKRNAQKCQFFLPDPWTFSEEAFPDELKPAVDLPRYFAKNYLNISFAKGFGLFLRFISSIRPALAVKLGLNELIPTLICFLKSPRKYYPFISFIDVVSTELFLKYYSHYQPRFSILFLNSIAHLQHHHWTPTPLSKNTALKFGMRRLDEIIGRLFEVIGPETSFIVANGLSQENTNHEEPWFLYRLKDQRRFLEAMQIPFSRIEEHMTYDAHLFFDSASNCDKAAKILSSVQVGSHPLFLVEKYPLEPKKLFYRINFSKNLPHDASFSGEETHRFYDFFNRIVQRTGKHIPNGCLLAKNIELKPRISNHEVYDAVLNHFSTAQRQAKTF